MWSDVARGAKNSKDLERFQSGLRIRAVVDARAMRTAALVSASLIAASAFSAQRHRPRMSAAPAAEGGDASLCICGCGVLGSMIAGQWTSAHPHIVVESGQLAVRVRPTLRVVALCTCA